MCKINSGRTIFHKSVFYVTCLKTKCQLILKKGHLIPISNESYAIISARPNRKK